MREALFSKFFLRDHLLSLSVDRSQFSATQIRVAIERQQRALQAHGVRQGACVGVWAQRDVRTIIAILANLRAGVVTVPLNPSLGRMELEHILNDARPTILFAADPAAIVTPSVAIVLDDLPAEHALDEPPSRATLDDHSAHDSAFVLYTSGTTGLPKGAMLSIRNLLCSLQGLERAWELGPADTVIHALPLFHVHGLCVGLLGALAAGAAFHWITQFEPAVLADAIADISVNSQAVLYAVPTMYHRLAELAERSPHVASALRRARLLISGSAALPTREIERIYRVTGQYVRERYGLTETLINTAVRAADLPRPGWVGPALDQIECRLVDDARKPTIASDGESIGEVAVRGDNVFEGYLHRPDATASVRDENGWFYTGDLAVMSADGWLKIVGRRASDLIKSGGYKIGAGEIEAALLEHAAVRECAVVSVEDSDLGEKIIAFVVCDPQQSAVSERELQQWVTELLAPHKRPRVVCFVDELPRNAMGKVLKTELKKMVQPAQKASS
jgi:malonyl-CoA/methylmalonyl-CoA synthetase